MAKLIKTVVAVGLILSLLACATQKTPPPQGPLRMWNANEMAEMNQATAFIKDKQGRQLSARVQVADVQQMILVKQQIEQAAGELRPGLFIAEGDAPNGFSFTTHHGPTIAVSVGMLNLLGADQSAMAALIGHELAHLYLQHAEKRQAREEQRMGVSVGLGFLLGMFGLPVLADVTDAASSPFSRMFSRDEEREADREGVKYMAQAGFDLEGAIRLQQKLAEVQAEDGLPFLSSHPSNQERINNMRRLIAQYQKQAKNINHSDGDKHR